MSYNSAYGSSSSSSSSSATIEFACAASATHRCDAQGANDISMLMTGNSLTLTPGVYVLGGTVQTNGSSSGALRYTYAKWFHTNGDDVTGIGAKTDPLVPTQGANNFIVYVPQENAVTGAGALFALPRFVYTVTSTETVYLVPSWAGNSYTPGNMTIQVYLEAEKIG